MAWGLSQSTAGLVGGNDGKHSLNNATGSFYSGSILDLIPEFKRGKREKDRILQWRTMIIPLRLELLS